MDRIELPGIGSRAQELYAFLRNAILVGDLESDERLVEERIATLASVSRTPVREAIRQLEVDGLVRRTNLGLVVSGVSDEELRELCEVRQMLEALACRLAAESRTQLDLDALEQICDEYRQADDREEVGTMVEVNRAFHETIWRMAHNGYLSRELRGLSSRIHGLQPTTLTLERRRHQSVREHAQIATAIGAREADAAERLAREHFGRAMAIRLSRRAVGEPARQTS